MDLTALIRNRRSVQLYEDRAVPTAVIEELLETAVWAPNHHLTQPWRFILVQGEGRRIIAEARRLWAEAEAAGFDAEHKQQRGAQAYAKTMAVPAILVVVMQEDPQLVVRDEDLVATACVVQNFLLLAEERGLATAVKSYGAAHHAPFRQGLGIAPGERVVVAIQIGYPARIQQGVPRAPIRDRLRIVE